MSVAVILSPLRTLLMPAIGEASLPESSDPSAVEAAIALSAIAVAAQEKPTPAFAVAARSLSKHHFVDGRHTGSQAALDTGGNFVAG